ncbi:MAG: hypothetical protein PWP24_406 [Clostridiales bacterium]|nr:hypothetical protein [Clostridiales bacterium]
MEQILQKLEAFLEKEDKEAAVTYIMELVEQGSLDVLDLYRHVLTPSLNNMTCSLEDQRICIWKEHVRSSIVRTIIECCYPFVIKKQKEQHTPIKGTAIVLCPPGEYHDIGARMVADFFTAASYDTIFVGSNTPYEDFYAAISYVKPDIIAISVSNYYNLVATHNMVEEIRLIYKEPLRIVVGGQAFINHTNEKLASVGADSYVSCYEDILNL